MQKQIKTHIKAKKQSKRSTKKSQRKNKKTKDWNHLPKKLSEKHFTRFFLPHLSLPLRSRKPKIPLWKIFNYILYQLDTGCQWDKITICIDSLTGKREISYTAIWKWFDRWSGDGSFERAFIGSVITLKEKKKLKIGKRIHGDGTNTVAKKGAKPLGIQDTSIRKEARSSEP